MKRPKRFFILLGLNFGVESNRNTDVVIQILFFGLVVELRESCDRSQ